jgi:hypothetical protein
MRQKKPCVKLKVSRYDVSRICASRFTAFLISPVRLPLTLSKKENISIRIPTHLKQHAELADVLHGTA